MATRSAAAPFIDYNLVLLAQVEKVLAQVENKPAQFLDGRRPVGHDGELVLDERPPEQTYSAA
jgi:hypothetical protein